MRRTDILARASECVCGDREHDYGGPEKMDSWIDLAGYAACGGECASADAEDIQTAEDVMSELMARFDILCEQFTCDECPLQMDDFCELAQGLLIKDQLEYAIHKLEHTSDEQRKKQEDEDEH